MCMLCVIPPNTTPSRDKLENSALNNPDGFGFAIAIPDEDRIHVETTMNPDSSINRFLEMREMYPDTYAVWHARLATHGSTNIDNCHPFRVGGDSRTVLAHNGVLPVLIDKGDKRSDTRVFAEDVLPVIGGVKALDNEQIFNVMEDFCSGSKVCILTVDPSAEHTCYVINEKLGKFDDTGVWWSNDSCELRSYYSYDYGNKWRSTRSLADFYGDEKEYKALNHVVRNPNSATDYWCYVCQNEVSWANDAYCPFCTSCLDCMAMKSDCFCYVPDNYFKLGDKK
jgi:hypothetical protein